MFIKVYFFFSQIKVSQTFKTNNAEHVDTWERTVPMYNSSVNPNWFCNISKQTNSQGLFPSQKKVLIGTLDVSSRAIVSPAKFVIDERALKQLSLKEEKNLVFDEQACKKNENSSHVSNDLFKKPLPPDQKLGDKKSIIVIKTPELIDDVGKVFTKEDNKKHKLDTSQLKKRLRSLVASEPEKKGNVQLCWSLIFFILLPAAIISLAMVLSNAVTTSSFCTPRLSLKKITEKLKTNVYGQDSAVSELAKFFNEKDNQTSFEVMAFVGGIGVGKSHTAEIIKNNIKDTNKILDFFPPILNKEGQAYEALSICRCNLIRLENLKTDDIADAASFISNLKMRTEKYCILVLAIFNTEEVDHNLKRTINYERSISMIKDKFKEAQLKPSVVLFQSLSSEALAKCIMDAGDYNNVELSKDNIDYVMRDLLSAESGCKGAYAKVQLVGRA